MNLVEIAGHLGADPETRVTPNGLKITTLRLATNSRRAGKDETIWWRVTIFGDRFDKMLIHIKKGSPLIVLGELNKPEIWMDKEGRPQITLEVVAEMLKFNPFGKADRPEGSSAAGTNSYSNSAPQQQQQNYGGGYGSSPSYSPPSSHSEAPYGGEPHYQPSHQPYSTHNPNGGSARNDEEIPF